MDFDDGRQIGFGRVAQRHAARVVLKNALSNVG